MWMGGDCTYLLLHPEHERTCVNLNFHELGSIGTKMMGIASVSLLAGLHETWLDGGLTGCRAPYSVALILEPRQQSLCFSEPLSLFGYQVISTDISTHLVPEKRKLKI